MTQEESVAEQAKENVPEDTKIEEKISEQPIEVLSQESIAETLIAPELRQNSSLVAQLSAFEQELTTVTERHPFEVSRDMAYLQAWLRNLSPFEIDQLLKLEEKESAVRSEILQTYFEMIHSQEDSEDEELEMVFTKREEAETPTFGNVEEMPQQTTSILRSLPVTQRKSETL
jgi:hypothetical protein